MKPWAQNEKGYLDPGQQDDNQWDINLLQTIPGEIVM